MANILNLQGNFTGPVVVNGNMSNGSSNTITDDMNCHAEGIETTASGEGSHSSGYKTSAAGDYSSTFGTETVTESDATNSIAAGIKAVALRPNSFVWNGDNNIINDDGTDVYNQPGTDGGQFCINPNGGTGGFYIGTESLSKILSDKISDSETNIKSDILKPSGELNKSKVSIISKDNDDNTYLSDSKITESELSKLSGIDGLGGNETIKSSLDNIKNTRNKDVKDIKTPNGVNIGKELVHTSGTEVISGKKIFKDSDSNNTVVYIASESISNKEKPDSDVTNSDDTESDVTESDDTESHTNKLSFSFINKNDTNTSNIKDSGGVKLSVSKNKDTSIELYATNYDTTDANKITSIKLVCPNNSTSYTQAPSPIAIKDEEVRKHQISTVEYTDNSINDFKKSIDNDYVPKNKDSTIEGAIIIKNKLYVTEVDDTYSDKTEISVVNRGYLKEQLTRCLTSNSNSRQTIENGLLVQKELKSEKDVTLSDTTDVVNARSLSSILKNYVNTVSDQSISGSKTFNNTVFLTNSSYTYNTIKDSKLDFASINSISLKNYVNGFVNDTENKIAKLDNAQTFTETNTFSKDIVLNNSSLSKEILSRVSFNDGRDYSAIKVSASSDSYIPAVSIKNKLNNSWEIGSSSENLYFTHTSANKAITSQYVLKKDTGLFNIASEEWVKNKFKVLRRKCVRTLLWGNEKFSKNVAHTPYHISISQKINPADISWIDYLAQITVEGLKGDTYNWNQYYDKDLRVSAMMLSDDWTKFDSLIVEYGWGDHAYYPSTHEIDVQHLLNMSERLYNGYKENDYNTPLVNISLTGNMHAYWCILGHMACSHHDRFYTVVNNVYFHALYGVKHTYVMD